LPAVPKSCGAYQCSGEVCPTKCFVDDDCISGLVCLASVCTKPVPDAGVDAGEGGAPETTPDASVGGSSVGGGQNDAGPDASNDASDDGSMNSEGGANSEMDAGTAPVSVDKGSCGCRVPGLPTRSPLPLLLGLGLSVYAWRRRRARPARAVRPAARP
jgi:hypothetical protein